MDVKDSLDSMRRRIDAYNKPEDGKYDWEHEGILHRCIPKILFKGNPVLVSFLQLIDMRIILTLKYVRRMHHFKDFMSM